MKSQVLLWLATALVSIVVTLTTDLALSRSLGLAVTILAIIGLVQAALPRIQKAPVSEAAPSSQRDFSIDAPSHFEAAPVTTFAVSPCTSALKIGAGERYIYMTHDESNVLTVVDVSTHTLATSIGVGRSPKQIVIHQDGRQLFVLCKSAISVIDTASHLLVGTIPLTRPTPAYAMALDGFRDRLWAVDEHGIFWVDLRNHSIQEVLKFDSPLTHGAALGLDMSHLYVYRVGASPDLMVREWQRQLLVLDLETRDVLRNLKLEEVAGTQVRPTSLIVRPHMSTIYLMTSLVTASLFEVVDTSAGTIATSHSVGSQFHRAEMIISMNGRRLYFLVGGAQVQVVDPLTSVKQHEIKLKGKGWRDSLSAGFDTTTSGMLYIVDERGQVNAYRVEA